MNRLLGITVSTGIIAIALLLLVLSAGGGNPLLYSAVGNVSTENQADPSTLAVMTTEESETILPLMDDILGLSYDTVLQLVLSDPEYAARYLTSYDSSVSRLGTNALKIRLTATDIYAYDKESAALGTSMQVILDDIIRFEEIAELKELYTSEGNNSGLYGLAAEALLLQNELNLAALNYEDSADVIEDIAEKYNLDASQIRESVTLIKQLADSASETYGYGSTVTDTSGSITLSVSPDFAYYGDTVTMSGIAKNTPANLSIYWDTNLWGSAMVNSAGGFTKSLTVQQIPAGTHTITVQAGGITSKTVDITILTQPSVVTITKTTQTNGEEHRLLTVYGTLKAESGIAVRNAPVSLYSEDHILIGTSYTTTNGVWSVSSELIDGGYAFYGLFNDPSFPLEANMSELYPVSIIDLTIYYILLIVAVGILIILVIRFIVRRKNAAKKITALPPELQRKQTGNTLINAFKDIFSRKGKTNAEKLSALYLQITSALAEAEHIQNISVLTPREILRMLAAPAEPIREFIPAYEYLHYANVTVDSEQLQRMELLAKQIIKVYYENNE